MLSEFHIITQVVRFEPNRINSRIKMCANILRRIFRCELFGICLQIVLIKMWLVWKSILRIRKYWK